MTEAVRTDPGASWLSVIWSARHDPAARILNVDLLTILIAIMLPWSTTGVVILVALWIVALVPTLELRGFLQSLTRPICALPIALFALALLGTLWSDAAWGARLYAVAPTAKLLVLPLLLYHFERSPRGLWVFAGFLASCTLLMAVSWLVAFEPNLSLKPNTLQRGIFVKNYIDQSQEFALCAVALIYPIMTFVQTGRVRLAALFAALALGFLVNMTFVVISRTALVTVPIMLVVFALLHLRLRTTIVAFGVAALLTAVIWNVSVELRATASKIFGDYKQTAIQNNPTGVGSRLEFWQKSLRFFAEAPVIGHGTGSTRGLFEQAAIGQIGAHAEIVANPHNQTLNVALQWGVTGVIVLYAMWALHLLLFRGDGLATWIGLMVVVQNVFTSLFNSHLFDFHEGWMYVLGVGVAGGMTLGARAHPSSWRPVSAGSAAAARAFSSESLPRTRSGVETGSRQENASNQESRAPFRFYRNGKGSSQVFSKILAGLAVFVFLFGAWFLSNYFRTRPVETALDRETRSIVTALREYRLARGAYPVLPLADSPMIDLKKELAKGGYFHAEAGDFSGPDQEARYVSFDGRVYGLLFHDDRTDDNPSGTCFIEVGVSGTGWWGRPPKCRFHVATCLEPFAMFQDPACWNGLAWRY
jgi:O-antigen ligase